MSDQSRLNGNGQTPVWHRGGTTNLPARQLYLDAALPRVGNGGSPPLPIEYWYMLRRRKGLLGLIASLGLLVGVLITLSQTPVYQARTVLELQNLNENFLNMRDVSPTAQESSAALLQTNLQTQVNILQSESVLVGGMNKHNLRARLVAERNNGRFGESRNALWFLKSRPAKSAPTATTEDILHFMAGNLKVQTEADTRLVEIFYDSADPVMAADVANALTDEFIQQNLESHWKTTQQTGAWLTRQMEDVRTKLEKSEEQLQAYARTAGLVFTSEKDNVAEAKLRLLQGELSRVQAERVTWQSKEEQATTASPDSLPEVLDDATLQGYQVKLTDLRRQLAELSSSLTPLHPSVKKVQAQVAALEAERDRERTNIIRRIDNEFASAQRRERLLAASYDAQALLLTEQAAKATHYDILKREVDNNRQIYDSMLQHVREAGIASTLLASNVRVIDPAWPPARPYKPNLFTSSLLGLFAGGFFGIVFIALRERADRSIQVPGEASFYLDVPEFGVIPSGYGERSPSFAYYRQARDAEPKQIENNRKIPVELAIWYTGPSALTESFRSTLTSIMFTRGNGSGPRVIALTSANPGEGKTMVASNLALAAAEIGRRVLLIDGDLRKPRLHEIFGVPNTWGLSDLLNGTKPPEGSEGIVAAVGYRDLYLLPAGSVASSISNLLHSPRALDLLKQMRRDFDMIIIDTPPMLQMPDARIVGRLADGVVLVVRSTRTTKEAAAAASQRLAEDGTRLLGTVLNEWDSRRPRFAAYE